ncbi:sensor histidine kinase [Spirillospora sp. NBC_00431]
MGLTRGGSAEKGRWIGTGPRVPAGTGTVLGGAALGGAAIAEAVGRAAISGWSLSYALVFCLLGLAGTLPLAFLAPVTAAAGVSAVTVLSLAGFRTLTVAALCANLIVVYRLGRTGPRRGAAVLLTPAAALAFLLLALLNDPAPEDEALTLVLASLAPLAAWAGSTRRARADAERHGAAREAIMGRLLEHTARGERARIARELHDVVAHHISMIAVQAETARLATPGMPAAGARRLSEIGDTARAGLTEMRRLLGVLREDTEAGAAEARGPQPGLGQLNELLDDARDNNTAGTRLIMTGRPVTLDSGIELAAFRIVQEALTNARRHAPGAAVDVEVEYAEEALRLRIRDNGPGPPAAPSGPGHGHGLTGMRERAAAVGGRLSSGPAPGSGFLVEAALPTTVDQARLGTAGAVDAGTVDDR